MTNRPAWSVPVRLSDVPADGFHRSIAADEATRAAVAREARVLGLNRLEADLEVTPRGRDGAHVRGTVSATVEQACVVTLDPLLNEVEEDVDLEFSRAAAVPPQASEVNLETAGDLPEPLEGDVIDLGAIAVESLLLGLDPYPRKAGVAFEQPEPNDPSDHPFAALAALKDKGKKEV
jgi:uncharacterized metal-binding protein YceD (DUF177 family)